MELDSRLGIKPNGFANGVSMAQGILHSLWLFLFEVGFPQISVPTASDPQVQCTLEFVVIAI